MCVWSCYEAFMDIECESECICSQKGAFGGWHWKNAVRLYRLAVHGYSSCEAFIGICIGNAFAARQGQKSGKGDSSSGQWY